MKNVALLPLCLLLAASAASVAALASQPAFDGPAASLAARQPRDVAPFTAVDAAGSMRVVLRQGSPQRVEVDASAADQAKVETTVEGGRLRVGRRREGRSMWSIEKFEGPVTVYVTAPSLTAVSVSGSGDLHVEGAVQAGDFRASVAGSGNLDMPQLTAQNLSISVAGSGSLNLPNLTAQRLKTSVAGSGDVTLAGRCPQHEIAIQGSGEVKATNLQTDDTSVRIGGSGNASITATKTLNSHIAGSGDVLVRGNPQISSSKSGSGSVRKG